MRVNSWKLQFDTMVSEQRQIGDELFLAMVMEFYVIQTQDTRAKGGSH